MKIEFFRKYDGSVLENTNDFLFIMNDLVYCDNGKSCESQSQCVDFEDFIERCSEMDWRVVKS